MTTQTETSLMQEVNCYCTYCRERTSWERIGETDNYMDGTRYHLYSCKVCESTKCLQTLLMEKEK